MNLHKRAWKKDEWQAGEGRETGITGKGGTDGGEGGLPI